MLYKLNDMDLCDWFLLFFEVEFNDIFILYRQFTKDDSIFTLKKTAFDLTHDKTMDLLV